MEYTFILPKNFNPEKHKLLIDVGHGGKDPGATSDGFIEKNINLNVAKVTVDYLRKAGLKVFMTREGDLAKDVKMELPERTQMGKKLGCEFIISIHTNAGGGDGAELIHSVLMDGQGDELCKSIGNKLTGFTGQNVRRIFNRAAASHPNLDYYGIINGARNRGYTGIIIEGFFIDNKKDREMFDTLEEQFKLGESIALGILDHFNIVYKERTMAEEVKVIADWKVAIGKKAVELGIIDETEWLTKLDEPAPVWMVLSVANKLKGGK